MQPVLRAAVSHGVVIRCEAEVDDAWVEADESQLEQTLLNLVTNAKDAAARTVRLRVRTTNRALGEAGERRPCVTLEVVDDGEGMTSDVRRKVFDPFFTTRFPGRGLGLAAVFGIVRKHGGEVEVESEPGRGTRFTLAFPRADPSSEPTLKVPRPTVERRLASSPPPRNGERVLVVDDEAYVRKLAARMLEALGMDAIGVADGTTALRELERAGSSVTCVLLDVTMPGLDGPTVLARMRESRPDLRIVMMSGHAERDVLGRCDEASPDALLPKPFGLEEFEEAVRPAAPLLPTGD